MMKPFNPKCPKCGLELTGEEYDTCLVHGKFTIECPKCKRNKLKDFKCPECGSISVRDIMGKDLFNLRNMLAEDGREMTPDELIDSIDEALFGGEEKEDSQ